MSNKESSWINIVRTIKLTPRERDSMRHSLVQFMEAHPVRDASTARLYIKPTHIIKIKFLTYKAMIIGLIIALVMGGSVSFAAENTIPGDALYPVKVYVNENARAAVAFTDKSKAELAVELANRRLEEAGKLAVRGTLDADTEASVATNVENRVKDARAKLATLKSHDEDGASEIKVDLSSVLRAHGVVLAKAKKDKEKEHNTDSVRSIEALGSVLAKIESEDEDNDNEDGGRMAMGAALMGTTTVMMNASSTPSITRDAAEGKKNAAQNKLKEVARKLGGTVTGTATTTAQVKFAEAQGVFAQGEISFNAGAYADAFYAFKQTMQLAQQAKRLADLEEEFTGEFNVDLHESDDEDGDTDNRDNSTTTPSRKEDDKDNERNGKENSSGMNSDMRTRGGVDDDEGITFEEDARIPSGPPGSISISRDGPSSVVEWKGTRDDTVLGYEVYRSCSQGEWVKLGFVRLSTSDERNTGLYRHGDSFSGECKYSVAAVGSDGKPGPRSMSVE